MSDQMASLYEIDLELGINDGAPYAALTTRRASLEALAERNAFDLVILGGGLTGATVAHEAALRGITVLLLEPGFFGLGALSWDVHLARYLRLKPQEVFRSRAALRLLSRSRAPHLISAMPVDSHKNSQIFAKLARRIVELKSVDEALLIRETVLAARQEGAVVLSSTEPTYVEAEAQSGCYMVGFKDSESGSSYQVRAGGVVVDPTHGRLPSSRMGSCVAPFQEPTDAGVAFAFEVRPTTITSGVPFASFELTDGSCVTVAKRGLAVVEVAVLFGKTPVPEQVQIHVAEEACKEAGWTIVNHLSHHRVFGKGSDTYSVTQTRGIFTCSHRAPWDAFRSAKSIVKSVVALTAEPRAVAGLGERLLPGGDYACELDSFRAMARAHGVPERTIELAISRWRGRVRYIAQFPNGLRELCPGVLRGEIDLSFVSDQAVRSEDVLAGSLRFDSLPGWQDYADVVKERLELLKLHA